MIAANRFWLDLHRLAESYREEGLSACERSKNIIDQFEKMPAIAQRELLADLRQLTCSVPDLYPLAVAVASDAAARPQREAG